MGARAAISAEEYLHTSFPDLDREYRDGELVERSLPDYLHGRVQYLLCLLFGALQGRFKVYPCVETRMRIRENLYIIPDVAVFHPDEPSRIPDSPPLVVVEVLSLDDRLASVLEKLEEYRTWGVAHVWLVDPHLRRFYTCDAGLTEVLSLQLPEFDLEIKPADLFQ